MVFIFECNIKCSSFFSSHSDEQFAHLVIRFKCPNFKPAATRQVEQRLSAFYKLLLWL